MTILTQTYGGVSSLTITPASLASASWRQSDVVDNAGANNFLDVMVGGLIRVGTVTAEGYLAIYAYGSYDGVEYTAGLNGAADATITWGTTGRSGVNSYLNLPLLGIVAVDDTDDDDHVTWGPFSIAQAFGGMMPRKWGIVIYNGTGVALHATQTDAECQYSGLTLTST